MYSLQFLNFQSASVFVHVTEHEQSILTSQNFINYLKHFGKICKGL